MTDLQRLKVQLSAIHDQDTAHVLEWHLEASNEEKMRVWMAIQKLTTDDDVIRQIIGRFAQFGFTQISLMEQVK